MKSISSALQTHLGQAATSLATLWKISRTDGAVLGFTDHDQELDYNDGTQLWDQDLIIPDTGSGTSIDSGPFNPTQGYELAIFAGAAASGSFSTASAGWAALSGVNTLGGVWFKWLTSRAKDECVVTESVSNNSAGALATWYMGTQFAPTLNAHFASTPGPVGVNQYQFTSWLPTNVKKGNYLIVVLQVTGDGGNTGIAVTADLWGTLTKVADVSNGANSQVQIWISVAAPSTPLFSGSVNVNAGPHGLANLATNAFIFDGTSVVQYEPAQGFTPSAIEGNSNLSTDNLEVTSFLEVGAITDTDLRSGLYDACQIEIRLVNYTDLTQGDLKLRAGTVGNVVVKNGYGQFEIRGLIYRTAIAIGKLFGPTCRAELGDSDCGIDLTLWQQNGTVNTVADRRTFNPSSGLLMRGSGTPSSPAPGGWFNAGLLTWTSGANLGFSMEISNWNGATILLFESMPFDIEPSDTFVIFPGCNLLAGATGDCFNKFNNIINFRGEPFIPGMDQLVIYPNADGSVPG